MSISCGIKPDWKVVLGIEKNVRWLAYHLQVVEGAIQFLENPDEYFDMPSSSLKAVADMILPILMGNEWYDQKDRPMTYEEARSTGYLLYPLGHHNWVTCLHRDNFATYVVNDDPAPMARAKGKISWHCPFSLREHNQLDCQNKLFTCAEDPTDSESRMNFTFPAGSVGIHGESAGNNEALRALRHDLPGQRRQCGVHQGHS